MRFYLREAGEYVGPFCSRRDAGRFLEMMSCFGADTEGIEIISLSHGTGARRPMGGLNARVRHGGSRVPRETAAAVAK